MTWRNLLHRTSLILGLVSLILALLGGMHLQHLLDDEGNRHAGETVVALFIALLVFVGSWFGARFQTEHQ